MKQCAAVYVRVTVTCCPVDCSHALLWQCQRPQKTAIQRSEPRINMAGHWARQERQALRVRKLCWLRFACYYNLKQQEHRAERQEAKFHAKAVNAALHGNIGRAVHMEVSCTIRKRMRGYVLWRAWCLFVRLYTYIHVYMLLITTVTHCSSLSGIC